MTVRELIGQRIKALREAQGLSLSEFARRCGTQRQTVHVWEQGRAKPVDEAMIVVAKALNTSISYLYGETEHPGPAPDWGRPGVASNEHQSKAKLAGNRLREALTLIDELSGG